MRHIYARPELHSRQSSSSRRRLSREFSSHSPSASRRTGGRARKASIDSVQSQAVSIGGESVGGEDEGGMQWEDPQRGSAPLRRSDSAMSSRSSIGFGRRRQLPQRAGSYREQHRYDGDEMDDDRNAPISPSRSKGLLGSLMSSFRGGDDEAAADEDGGASWRRRPGLGRRISTSSQASRGSRRSRDAGDRIDGSDGDDSDGYGLNDDDEDDDDDDGARLSDGRSASSSDDGGPGGRGGLLPSAFGTLGGSIDPVFGDSRFTTEHIPEDELDAELMGRRADEIGGGGSFSAFSNGYPVDHGADGGDLEALLPNGADGSGPAAAAGVSAAAAAAKAREDLSYLDKSSRSRQQIFLVEEDMLIRFTGYKAVFARKLVFWIVSVLSLGVIYLLGRWLPRTKLRWICREAAFEEADLIMVENQWGDLVKAQLETVPFARPLAAVFPDKVTRDAPATMQEFQAYLATAKSRIGSSASSLRKGASASTSVANSVLFPSAAAPAVATTDLTPLSNVESEQLMDLSVLDYRYTRFALYPPTGRFRMVKDWRDPAWQSTAAVSGGVSWDAEKDRKTLFGPNMIEIAAKSTWSLLVDEVLHPFYMFQIVSIILWSFDNYYYYAFCIALISITSILTTLLETRATIARMREMSRFTCQVRVLREGQWLQTDSSELIPGDVYDVAESGLLLFPADSVLLTGDAIVNESESSHSVNANGNC